MTRYPIIDLIPQKEPFVMIGELIRAEEGTTVTTFRISADNPLVVDSVFSAGGMIENIAQTAAAGMGYKCLTEKSAPPVGFIGGIKNLQIFSQPSVGSHITTLVKVEHEVLNARVVRGEIRIGDTLVASCEMKILAKSFFEVLRIKEKKAIWKRKM
ncbi:MAG: hypothetical protein FJY10_12220 [Bacteroidetes bacterium]|nr:hypothetical protein [Bacteroidota bacterium]